MYSHHDNEEAWVSPPIVESSSRETHEKRSSVQTTMCTLWSCLCRVNVPTSSYPYQRTLKDVFSSGGLHAGMRSVILDVVCNDIGESKAWRPAEDTGGTVYSRVEAIVEYTRRLPESNAHNQAVLMTSIWFNHVTSLFVNHWIQLWITYTKVWDC